MPQLNPIVLKDGAATPANHTYNPSGIVSGVATLVESTGVPIGNKRLTLALSQTATGRQKVTMKMVIPVVQDVEIAGVSRPTAVRAAYADLTFAFDGTSNPTERRDVVALVASLLGTADFKSVAVDLQDLY